MGRYIRSKNLAFRVLMPLWLAFAGCSRNENPLGSQKNPIKFFFLPSVDAQKLADKGHLVEKYLNANTPYVYKIGVPASYVAVIESFGTKRADIATLNPFGYLLANQRYGAHAVITPVRFGSELYQGQIVVRADSGITSVKQLNGKKIAFVDPSSTSGFLLPSKVLKEAGVVPRDTVFAQRHDSVITMVYQGQVDAGATFYTPEEEGKIQDARRLVLTQFPNVEKEIKILALTDEIPNDPIVVRKDLPPEIVETTVSALLKYMQTKEGKEVFHDLYGMTGMVRSSDERYNAVRDVLATLGQSASDLIR